VHSLALYALDDLQKILEKNTGSEFLPRSVLIATMEGTSYIFFAMGDGTLFHYQLNFHDGITNF
jgi:hypothetical protein